MKAGQDIHEFMFFSEYNKKRKQFVLAICIRKS